MKIIFTLLIIMGKLLAWEVYTHRAIDRMALESTKTQNLKNFIADSNIGSEAYKNEVFDTYNMTYFNYIQDGEQNGMSKFKQDFEDSKYQSLIEAGTMLEDAQWPHPKGTPDELDQVHGRFWNHFYNAQGILCKSLKCKEVNYGLHNLPIVIQLVLSLETPTDAVTWAYDTRKNKYDYVDALDYFAKGFSETKESERRRFQAKMLVSVGHMMHMMNDMNVPAHVRDDAHPYYEPLEIWMKGGNNHNQTTGFYISGNTLVKSGKIPTPKVDPIHWESFKKNMGAEADYTSLNYFSEDTIFAFSQTYPRKSDTYERTDEWLSPTVEKVYIVHNSDNKKRAIRVKSYIINALNQLYLDDDSNVSMAMGSTSVVDGDFSVIEDNGADLIPRAIANAEGFVNYFFRGRLETTSSLCGGLEVKNVSEPKYVASSDALVFKKGGVFKVYVDDANGNRTYLTEQTLTKDLPVDGAVYIDGVTQAYSSAFGTASGLVDVIVVYSGNIGEDGGVAVSSVIIDPGATPTEVPTATSGAVEVTLSWSEGGNNFDLDLAMPSSVKDIQSCMREHAYVASEYEIYPGRYPVNVSYAGGGYLTDTLYVTIVTPGEMKVLKIDTNTSSFDPGHVADIVVKYVDNKPVLTLTPAVPSSLVFSTPVESTGGSGGGGWGGGSGGGGGRYDSLTKKSCSPAMSCGCKPCEYYIIPYVSQVIKGPLSGADIALFDAAGYRTGTPLYSGLTGEGTDLYTAGLLNLPQTLIDDLDDDGLYILQVSGGTDIDRNDDMIVDRVITQNNAALHAVLTGADLKTIKPKVSVLTEIAYQIVHEAIMNAEETKSIFNTLDDVGARLLSTKIYPQSVGNISHVDILEWLPTIDRKILFADYTERIQPIIDKLQVEEDIYQDAYDVVYYPDGVYPIIRSAQFNVPENTPVGTTIGRIDVMNEGESPIVGMTFSGEGNASFAVDAAGNVILVHPVDYEAKQFYSLFVSAKNAQGYSVPTAVYVNVGDILDAPVITGFSAPIVYSSSPAGTSVGTISFSEGNSSVTAVTLSGADSDYFHVDLAGAIAVAKMLENYPTKKSYKFAVTVSNASGDSRSANITLNISDGHELPVLEDTNINVTENTPAGSIIGHIRVASEGLSPINTFMLSENDVFTINEQGEIIVTGTVPLDFETKQSYQMTALARNSYGESNLVDVAVNIENIPDTPPTVYSASMQIDENSPVGTAIGSIRLKEGEAMVDSIGIIGSGQELFTADPDGTVRVAGNLDYESNKSYALTFSAVSVLGESNIATLKIGINNVPEVVPTLQGITISRHFREFFVGQILGKLLVDAGDTPIRTISLQPDSPFGVSSDGVLYLATAFRGETNEFNLTAEAVNGFGASNKANVSIHVDAQPILLLTELAVDENVSGGTVIGKISILSEGMVPIESFTPDSPLFTIDNHGTVSVALGTQLDYETYPDYHVSVIAHNRFGSSDPVPLNILVKNIPETAPTLRDLNVTIDKQSMLGRIVGNVLVDRGDSDVEYIELSPASPFKVSTSGTVVVDGDLLEEGKTLFALKARAKNAFGYSNETAVNILLNTAIEIGDSSISVYNNTSGGTVIGHLKMLLNGNRVDTISFEGTGSEDFAVDLNGTIRVAENVILQSSRQGHYHLTVHVNGTSEATIDIWVDSRLIASIVPGNNARGVLLSSDGIEAYLIDGKGLYVIDVNNSKAPTAVGSVEGSGLTSGISLSSEGTKLYATAYNGIVKIIDVNNSTAPFEDVLIQAGHNLVDVVLSPERTMAYVIDVDGEDTRTLKIVDISDPSVPAVLSSTTLAYPLHIALSPDGMTAYIADDYRGLEIMDIRNPSAPVLIGSIRPLDRINNVAVSLNGDIVYALDGQYLRIVNCADPASPSVLRSIYVFGYAQQITLSENGAKVYVSSYTNGHTSIEIIDVSNPLTPSLLASVGMSNSVYDIAVSPDDETAYIANGTAGLSVVAVSGLDIQDKRPGMLALQEVIDEDTAIGSFIGKLSVLYTGTGGILSFGLEGEGSEDFSVDANGVITLARRLDYSARNEYSLLATAVNSVGESKVPVNITVHTVPKILPFIGEVYSRSVPGTLVGRLDMWVDTNATLSAIALTGTGSENFTVNTNGEIFVAEGAQLHHFIMPYYDLQVTAANRFGSGEASSVRVNVSPVAARIKLADRYASHMLFSTDEVKVYTVDQSVINDALFKVIDVSDRTSPVTLGAFELVAAGRFTMTLDGNTIITSEPFSNRIHIIDITNPGAPTNSYVDVENLVLDGIALSPDGKVAYIASDYYGIQIVDVSQPENASILSVVDISGYTTDVALSPDGAITYAASGDTTTATLTVVDVKDPAAPSVIGSVETFGGYSYEKRVILSSDGAIAFVTGYDDHSDSASVQVIDVSDPSVPTIVGSIDDIPEEIVDITLSLDGKIAFAAGLENNVYVIKVDDSTHPTLRSSYYIENGIHEIHMSFDPEKCYFLDFAGNLDIVDLKGLQ